MRFFKCLPIFGAKIRNKGVLDMAINKESYTVEGMSCNHCKMAVEKEVKALPGMVSAIVDLAAKTLTVEYDGEKTNPAAIKIAVEEAGFTVA